MTAFGRKLLGCRGTAERRDHISSTKDVTTRGWQPTNMPRPYGGNIWALTARPILSLAANDLENELRGPAPCSIRASHASAEQRGSRQNGKRPYSVR